MADVCRAIRANRRSALTLTCALGSLMALVFILQPLLRSPHSETQIHSTDISFVRGLISSAQYGRQYFGRSTGRSEETAIVFLAAYTKFPPGTPLGDLFYLKSVLVARRFNPTTPIIFLLPKETISRHPEMVELLGTYRINVRWIDGLENGPLVKQFHQKHQAYCARLNITNCFWDLMYTRFGMAADLLRSEGYQRALFLDNDVGLYEDISFFTQYPEGWISAFDWTTQVALWDVDTMEHFFRWLMHYFDTEPPPVNEDPGDMLGARLFLRRHPQISRRILCGPGESLKCGTGDVYQAIESVQHVGCDLVNQTACPLYDCADNFEKMITWRSDSEGRFVPFLHGEDGAHTRLPVIHFGDACEPAINTKMYPITLEGLQPATNATY